MASVDPRRKAARGVTVAAALVVGGALLTLKVWLWFSEWLVPYLVEAVNGVAFLVVLVLTLALSRGTNNRSRSAAVMLALGVAMLDLGVVIALAQTRVNDAKAYCQSGCTGGRPALFRPGYSVRYVARCDSSHGATVCMFPDPFPGRTFWQGERRPDGAWTWEHLMD